MLCVGMCVHACVFGCFCELLALVASGRGFMGARDQVKLYE